MILLKLHLHTGWIVSSLSVLCYDTVPVKYKKLCCNELKGEIMYKLLLKAPALLFVLFILSGCAANKQIYLEPMRLSGEPLQASAATILFQPLQNSFAVKQKGIGTHSIGGKSVGIVSDYAVITDSFNALLQKKIGEKGWQVAPTTGWNMTPDGLAGLSLKRGTVLSGVIEKLMITAETGRTRTNTTYTLNAVVVIAVGDISAMKMTRRTIEMQEKTINVTYGRQTMEEILNGFVKEVGQRVIEEYATFLKL